VVEGTELAPGVSLRRAAETALAALLAAVGPRHARLELLEASGEAPWVLTRNEAGDLSFTRGGPVPADRDEDAHWMSLAADPPPPAGEDRRRALAPGAPRAWIRFDPAPGPGERDRLEPTRRLAALLLESVHHLARYERDPGTGLLNRAALLARLEESLGAEAKSPLALLLLEVGGEGDEAARLRVAAVLAGRCLRERDTLARLESGILAALLPGADGGQAAAAAGRLQRALRRHEQRMPAASGGLAVAPHHGREPEVLLGRASRALEEARRREETVVLLYHEGLVRE
jgi:GGDEF domain-containing protein